VSFKFALNLLLTNWIRHPEGTGLVEWGLSGRLFLEDSMSILAAIRREEKRVKKQLAKLQHNLIGLQSAAKALGKSANRDLTSAKKRVLSGRRVNDFETGAHEV
jgi:hypothetical protein